MIEELLTGRREPGLCRWAASRRDAAREVTEAERAGWRVFWLDGRGVRGEEAFLARCAEEFVLPSYAGHDLDALGDCLIDLSWAPATCGYVVVYDHWEELAEADPTTHRTVVGIFEKATDHWRGRSTPMAVLLLSEERDAGVTTAG